MHCYRGPRLHQDYLVHLRGWHTGRVSHPYSRFPTKNTNKISTEFGDCPTVASCATATQATATTTISPDFPWVGDFEYEEDESIAEDAETAPVEDQTDEFYEEEFDELGYDDTDNSTDTTTTETATSTDTTTSSDTATSETETTTDTATSETSTETEETTTTETSEFTSTPSTLITTTRSSEQSSDTTTNMITSTETTAPATTTEATRTYFPCVVRAGPNVPDPYCQCETTVEGKHYVVSTSLVSNACDSYTEFPSTVNPATEAPPPTEAPIEEPYTQTVDGTVLAYSSYKLVYNKVWSDVTVTNTRGLGDPSTVATPVPTQTDVNHDGSDICSSSDKNVRNALGGACQETIDKFEDDTIYGGYTSRYSRMGSILKALTFGKAGCTVQFECEDYGIGMSGKLIKEARAKAKDEGMERCGNIFLSNSCKIHVDYCTNCHNDGP
ncbi:hypothetical protein NM208_g13522 [Fusarium decemcellulare]|uniref:Uncharacterized protein n=1 Tax=Fusarium decemcellulare TaxID=57161 RepID=A0ACC1RLE6_9HYPO|nr:hypothetical protein NM208_g13522 [Fusarium decemcellulare]